MLRNSSVSSSHCLAESLWTWEEVLSKCPSKCAAPVSAFQFQKVPLALHWNQITDGAIIGEVDLLDLTSGLHSLKSYKERLGIEGSKRKGGEKKLIKYWSVKVVQLEGYNLKVRFLGFPSHLQDKVTEHERWINYSQLKPFGSHVDNGATSSPPRLSDDVIPEPKEIMLKRLKDAFPANTVNPVVMRSIEKEEKEFRWKKMFTRVEVRNKTCWNEMLPGYISKTIGRRLQVMYWCTSDPAFQHKGIWVHEDSDLIHLEGWTKTAGAKMNASVEDYYPTPLEPTKLGHAVQQGASINIKVDMMFELINPLKLDEIAVGQVSNVLSHGYFTCDIVSIVYEDDLNRRSSGVNEFHFHITSDQLFPLGSFAGETPSVRPFDAENNEEFTWASYLETNGYEELPLPHKNNDDHGFEENMLIEAVDAEDPELICPAKILKIVHPHAMKVRFLGWGPEYDQWKPIKSQEIFPVGWCQFRGYPLEPPPIPSLEGAAPIAQHTVVVDSPVPVKRGRGKSRKRQPTGTGAVVADPVTVGSRTTKDNLKKRSKPHSVPEKKRTRRSSATRTVCATTSYYNLRPRPSPRVSRTDSANTQVLSLTKENLEKLKKQSRSVLRPGPGPDNDKKKVSHPRKCRSLVTSFSRL